MLIPKVVCNIFFSLPSAAHLVDIKSLSSFLLSSKINHIWSAWITQLFSMLLSPLMYSKIWSFILMQTFSLFCITWSRTFFITRYYIIFSSKTTLIWLTTALQLTFSREILCKNCNDIGSRMVELIKIGLWASIAIMFYIEAWYKVLTLLPFVSVLIISICLLRTCL